MANDIETLINGIITSKGKINTKLLAMGLGDGTLKLDAAADKIVAIVDHGTDDIDLGGQSTGTLPAGYYHGNTIKGGGSGAPETETKTVTPGPTSQTVTPTSGKLLSSVTVNPIPANYKDVTGMTALPGDVLAGKTYPSSTGMTTGTMPDNGAATKSLNTTTTEYTIPAGYHNGSGKVSITLEEKEATPSASEQNIEASTGKVISKITINPIPEKYGDVSSVTATAADLLSGKTAIAKDASGKAVTITGTMANKGVQELTMTGMTEAAAKVMLDAGYYAAGSYVKLDDTIYNALLAI